MRHLKFILAFIFLSVAIISSISAQKKTVSTPTTSISAQKQDDFLEQLRSLNNEATNCQPSKYSSIVEKRNALAANKDAIAEVYLRANELILLDNKLFECASASIAEANSKPDQPCPECPECPPEKVCPDCPPQQKCPPCPDQPGNPPQEHHDSSGAQIVQSDCSRQITYVAVGSGAALLLLILALLNALKAKKWLEAVFDKLHDQILDYFMSRLMAVLKLGDDEKFRKKIERLKELNSDRKVRKISVQDYLAGVDKVLVD